MKLNKIITLEIFVAVIFVVVATAVVYNKLHSVSSFWSADSFWSFALISCWIVVSSGYFHQGWLVHERKSAKGVSVLLPMAVFVLQCILFVKGVYYKDWSLFLGALIVNSGVVFNLYQIFKVRKFKV